MAVDIYKENLPGLPKFAGESAKTVSSEFSGFWRGIRNLWKGLTGSGLTDQQVMQNVYSSSEREAAQAFEERMSNTSIQRQVADMQAAGVNPALMYGSGSNGASTPSSSGASASGLTSLATMSDLMQLALLKPSIDNLKAQTQERLANVRNTNADTSLKEQQTKFQDLVNSRYNENMDATISKIYSDMGVNAQNIDESKQRSALLATENAMKEFEKEHQEEYFNLEMSLKRAERSLTLSKRDHENVLKAMDTLRRDYMHNYDSEMGENEYVGLITAVCALFGIKAKETVHEVTSAVKGAFQHRAGELSDSDKNPFERAADAID